MLLTRKVVLGCGLFGLTMVLGLAPEAQANWWRLCRPRVICPEELTRPPEILPKDPTKEEKKDPALDPVLAPVTTAALGDSSTAVPHIMGDYYGYCVRRVIQVPVTQTTTTVIPFDSDFPNSSRVITSTSTVYKDVVVCDPVASRAGSAFKVAENESPRPTDRVFVTYNYFDNIRGGGGFIPGVTTTEGGGQGLATVTTSTPSTQVAGRNIIVNRELFGFEKTFLGGDASVELRVPLFQARGGVTGLVSDDVGDITIVTKYAFINDRITGDVFSVGLAVTAPTGPDINTIYGNINSTLLQPFFGYIRMRDGFYFQGIHSIVFPTDSHDITLMLNDVGMGYVFRTGGSRMFAFVAPNFEVHVATPLTQRSGNGAVFASDTVTLTGGLHIGLGNGRPLLSIGLAAPVTGPKPFDVEAFVQFGFRF